VETKKKELKSKKKAQKIFELVLFFKNHWLS